MRLAAAFIFAGYLMSYAAEENPLGEWYECGWSLAAETKNTYKVFGAESGTREALVKLLDTLGVLYSTIKKSEQEMLVQGWLDAHAEQSRKYSIPKEQSRSLLPQVIQGFHPFPSKSGEANLADEAENWIKAVVLIKTDKGHGTGFFIAPGLILTNHHVIDGADSIEVKNDNFNESYRAKLKMSMEVPDIALLEVPLKQHHVLELSDSDSIKPLDDVVLIGYPKFDHLTATFSKGTVSSTDRIYLEKFEVFQVDITSYGGNSGGPLIGPDGGVVGIHTAALNDLRLSMKIAQKTNFILPYISKYLGK